MGREGHLTGILRIPRNRRAKDKHHVPGLHKVIGPPKEGIPDIRSKVVNDVLRKGKGREEAVGPHAARDV